MTALLSAMWRPAGWGKSFDPPVRLGRSPARARLWLVLVIATGALTACAASAPPGVQNVDAILITRYQAANWNREPGPDGIEVEVLLHNYAIAHATPAVGTLRFVMYDGGIRESDLEHAQPLWTRTYSSDQLTRYLLRSSQGWAHYLRLAWGTNVPETSIITLVVHYRSPTGTMTSSQPVYLSVGTE